MDGWVSLAISVAGAAVVRLVAGHHTGDRRAEPPPRPLVLESLIAPQEDTFVKLTGQVHSLGDALTAPLSGRRCVAYVAEAQAWRCKGVRHPTANAREMKTAPLLLVSRGGELTISGECVVALRATSLSPREPERELAFLEKRKLDGYLASTTFAEAILRDGDRISVTGVLLRDRGGESTYRDAPSQTRLVSRPDRPLTIQRARR